MLVTRRARVSCCAADMACRVGMGGCDDSNTNDKRVSSGTSQYHSSERPLIREFVPSEGGPTGGRRMLRAAGANTNTGSSYAIIANRSNQKLSVYLTKNEKEQGGSTGGGRKMLQGGSATTTSAAALQ